MFRARARIRLTCAALAALVLFTAVPSAAVADTTIDGPIDLGTATPFSVLGAAAVTNTGASVLNGDLGVSPETSITGFPPGVVNGEVHPTDAVAAQAQLDLTTAYNVAAGLTPAASGLGDLTDASLIPGVYAGGELALSGSLTLEGTAESVWIFQAASTLTIGSGATIILTGGASACNVFWQVGTSASIGTGAQFVGTVMADVSITAQSAATVTGRLLARTGAVTLDNNLITAPTECTTEPGTVSTSPTVTSSAPAAGEVGVDYSHAITASGSPTATYTLTSGALPAGLSLSATGVISGRPTTAGSSTFTIVVSNGTAPDQTVTYTISVGAAAAVGGGGTPGDELAESGIDAAGVPWTAAILLAGGGMLMLARRRKGTATV